MKYGPGKMYKPERNLDAWSNLFDVYMVSISWPLVAFYLLNINTIIDLNVSLDTLSLLRIVFSIV